MLPQDKHVHPDQYWYESNEIEVIEKINPFKEIC